MPLSLQETSLVSFAIGTAARAAVVASAGLVVSIVARRRSASLRAALAAATLAGVLVVPVLTNLPISVRAPIPLAASLDAGRFAASLRKVEPRGQPSRAAGVAAAKARPEMTPNLARSATTFAVLAWAFGSLVLLFRILVGWRSTRRLVHSARRASDRWQADARGIASELNVPRPIVVLEHDALAVPMTAGVLRPVILLPPDTRHWSIERRRLVLAHELAHVARRDCMIDYVARAACAVYWFLPMIWRVAAGLRQDRERACDDVVLSMGVRAPDYAEHLVDLVAYARAGGAGRVHAAALAMAPVGALESRVADILAERRRGSLSRRARLMVMGASAAVVIPVSAVVPRTASGPAFVLSGARDTVELPLGLNDVARWSGPLSRGAIVSVRANMGNISVDTTSSDEVEVIAQRRASPASAPADTRLAIVRAGNGIAVCSVYVDPARGRSPCEADGDWGRVSVENNVVSLRVRVPSGVAVRIQAANGDVKVSNLHGDVQVLDGNGDVNVASDGAADLTAFTGALDFKRLTGGEGGAIALRVLHGTISARLPDGASVDAAADTGTVTVSSPERATAFTGPRYLGIVAGGRSPLVARIQKGTVDISVQP